MCAAVIAHRYSAPIFQSSEHDFDFMTLFIKRFIIRDIALAVLLWRDARLYVFLAQGIPEPVGIIAAIAEHVAGLRQSAQHMTRALIIAGLPFRKKQDERSAVLITHRVQFGVYAAFRPTNAAGNIPFLSREHAVRCALRCVASIINPSGLSASAASSEKILLNTPIRLHRTNRLYNVLCGPYSDGASRHCRPRLMTKIIPLITRKSSTRATPRDGGKYGLILFSCDFVNQNKSLMMKAPFITSES